MPSTRETPRGVSTSRLSVLRFPFLRLAVAAAVVIAAAVAVRSLYGPSGKPMSFSQVRLATERMPWLHAVATRYQDGEVRTDRHWYSFAENEAYVVTDEGAVLSWDYGSEPKKLAYSPRLNAVVIAELPRPGLFGVSSAYNLVDAFAVLAAEDDVKVDEWAAEHEGKTVRAYGVEKVDPGFDVNGRPVARLKLAVMADPETKRIIAAQVEHQGRDGNVLAREEWVMSYPQSGPANVFDLGVPVTAKIIDRRRQIIGTPGDEPTPIPTPAPADGLRLVPLEISLPRPMFSGTPQNYRIPNLEKPRKGPRPPFLAPAGTVNLALGKPVSSSDREPVYGNLAMITDGDKEAAEGSIVELGPFPQHITIDLKEPCEIYAIVVWHHHRWPRVYFDVIAQVSNDRTFRTGVRTIFNNDTDNTVGLGAGPDQLYTETNEGKLIDCKGIRGRYIRLYSNGNMNDELNHYIEVEVYGRPAD